MKITVKQASAIAEMRTDTVEVTELTHGILLVVPNAPTLRRAVLLTSKGESVDYD